MLKVSLFMALQVYILQYTPSKPFQLSTLCNTINMIGFGGSYNWVSLFTYIQVGLSAE